MRCNFQTNSGGTVDKLGICEIYDDEVTYDISTVINNFTYTLYDGTVTKKFVVTGAFNCFTE